MPFKDTKEGQTHYFGDNCGEPEHNMSNVEKLRQQAQDTFKGVFNQAHVKVSDIEFPIGSSCEVMLDFSIDKAYNAGLKEATKRAIEIVKVEPTNWHKDYQTKKVCEAIADTLSNQLKEDDKQREK